MLRTRPFVAALMATTLLAGGVAYAADQAAQTAPPQETALQKDAGKLSADGARAYNDLALTRLAIFDGRVKDAKTFVDEADTAFGKAKSDDSVFVKAEADLKAPDGADRTAANDKTAAAKEPAGKTDETATPKRWLPVDAEMTVDEDYTANPKKAAAVTDADKSLAKGDKQGAMAKLKLADVNMTYVMAVVPLDQTLTDVHQAAQLVDGGKYYEASQLLRQVQDSARFDVLAENAVPAASAPPTASSGKPASATH